jgi:hypothetical protein
MPYIGSDQTKSSIPNGGFPLMLGGISGIQFDVKDSNR